MIASYLSEETKNYIIPYDGNIWIEFSHVSQIARLAATEETLANLLRGQRPGMHNDLFKLEADI